MELHSATTQTKFGHIPAIDGLRAFAVLSVIFFHFGFSNFGGFIGVDVFFVISGFLITGLLIRDVEVHQSVPLVNFWVRRVRRLIPAVLFMVITVVVCSFIFASLTVRLNLRIDTLSTLAYVANWHFINTASYFASDGTVSPLLHMWSLAVEEQFYIIWPLVILLISKLVKKNSRGILWVSVGLAILSASLLKTMWAADGIERAYMGTDSRAFQLLIGAALAALVAVKPSIRGSQQVRSLIAVLGFSSLLIFSFALGTATGPTSFYANGGALLVALASACLLWAMWAGSHALTPMFSNRIANYIGRLSYGMYLWHWPLFVFVGSELQQWGHLSKTATAIFLLGLTLCFASFSYHFIENPLRTRGFLVTWPNRKILSSVILALVCVGFTSYQALGRVGSEKIIMLVGDSVPARLTEKLDEYASTKGWHVVSAAKGSCPALGIWVADPDGKSFGRGESCRDDIKPLQQQTLKNYKPSVVIWWSRYEIADRFDTQGNHLNPTQSAFWQAQESDLQTQIRQLTPGNTQLLFIPIEPTGVGISSRCNSTKCHWFLRRLISSEGVGFQKQWNSILKTSADQSPNVEYFDVTSKVCHDNNIPCNDLIAGKTARSDGTHYVGLGVDAVVPAIINRAIAVAK